MKITQLTAENIKRLVAVQITPDGSLFVIGGENAAGKSSLLDSIAMVIGGGDQIPERPIRDGASKAQVILETEEFIATRQFNAKGTSLVIKNKEGVTFPSPQAMLDKLTSRISFDPLAFTRMEEKKQAETLRRLVGIDFTALETEHAGKYAERTAVNRDVKNQQVRVDQMQRHPDAPKEIVLNDPIMQRLGKAQEANAENSAKREKVVSANDAIESREVLRDQRNDEVGRLKRELDAAIKAFDAADVAWAEAKTARDKLYADIQALVDVDTAPIFEELKEVEATNTKVRENQAWQSEQEKLMALTKKANALTERLAAIDKEKADTLSKTKFPVAGLAFTPDGITFNGIPFSQASAAEQLRVSVAMGFALAPELKVALVRDGSLLDDKSLKLLGELTEAHGGQLFLERVGKGDECTVIIEDGQVSEDRTTAKKTK